jgi:hypothetical protein
MSKNEPSHENVGHRYQNCIDPATLIGMKFSERFSLISVRSYSDVHLDNKYIFKLTLGSRKHNENRTSYIAETVVKPKF